VVVVVVVMGQRSVFGRLDTARYDNKMFDVGRTADGEPAQSAARKHKEKNTQANSEYRHSLTFRVRAM